VSRKVETQSLSCDDELGGEAVGEATHSGVSQPESLVQRPVGGGEAGGEPGG
jgi:hypothetical protein